MRSDRPIGSVDLHTAAIGMRQLTSHLEPLPGTTIGDKRAWCLTGCGPFVFDPDDPVRTGDHWASPSP